MALCADVVFCWDVGCVVVLVLGFVIALALCGAFLSRMYINESLCRPSRINRVCHRSGLPSSLLNVYYAFLFVQNCDWVSMAQYVAHGLSANLVIFGWLAVGLITLEAAVTIQSKVLDKSRNKTVQKVGVQRFFKLSLRGVMFLYMVANILVLVAESEAYHTGRSWPRVLILNPYMILCIFFTLGVIWLGKVKLLRTLAAQDKLTIKLLGAAEHEIYKKLITRFQMALVWTTLLGIFGAFIYVYQTYELHNAGAYDLYQEGGWQYHFYYLVLVTGSLSLLWFGWVDSSKREVGSEPEVNSIKSGSKLSSKRLRPDSPSTRDGPASLGWQTDMYQDTASRARALSESLTDRVDTNSPDSSIVENEKNVEIEWVFTRSKGVDDLETRVSVGGKVSAVPRVSSDSPQLRPRSVPNSNKPTPQSPTRRSHSPNKEKTPLMGPRHSVNKEKTPQLGPRRSLSSSQKNSPTQLSTAITSNRLLEGLSSMNTLVLEEEQSLAAASPFNSVRALFSRTPKTSVRQSEDISELPFENAGTRSFDSSRHDTRISQSEDAKKSFDVSLQVPSRSMPALPTLSENGNKRAHTSYCMKNLPKLNVDESTLDVTSSSGFEVSEPLPEVQENSTELNEVGPPAFPKHRTAQRSQSEPAAESFHRPNSYISNCNYQQQPCPISVIIQLKFTYISKISGRFVSQFLEVFVLGVALSASKGLLAA
eukprot:g42625.t1